MPKETAVDFGPSERGKEAQVPLSPQQPGNPSSYVGTPAVGTSKAVSTAGIRAIGPPNSLPDKRRRRFAWSCIAAFLSAWFVAFFHSSDSSYPACSLNWRPSSKLAIQPITCSE
jgi:hypothetical protein